jgi:hypothetical protein
MDDHLTNDDRRELLRAALSYDAEAERTGCHAFHGFARELRRFAWTGAARSGNDQSSSLAHSGAGAI